MTTTKLLLLIKLTTNQHEKINTTQQLNGICPCSVSYYTAFFFFSFFKMISVAAKQDISDKSTVTELKQPMQPSGMSEKLYKSYENEKVSKQKMMGNRNKAGAGQIDN